MEGIPPNSMTRPVIEKKARPQKQLNCPRCTSSNTKFCYYNNYSLTQPRCFCKTCRRYWTEGGSLRNVPVGGGSRKNKKATITSTSSTSTSSSSSSIKVLPDLNPPTISSSILSHQNPKMHGGQDLNLAFPSMENYHHALPIPTQITTTNNPPLSALELLRSSMASRRLNMNMNNNPFAPNISSPLMLNSSAIFPNSGFPMQEVKPTSLGFSVDHHQGMNGNNRAYDPERGSDNRVLFPFGDVINNKQISEAEHNKEQGNNNSSGYWTGMIGEGPW